MPAKRPAKTIKKKVSTKPPKASEASAALEALHKLMEERLGRMEALLQERFERNTLDSQDVSEPGVLLSMNRAEGKILENYGEIQSVAQGQLVFAEGQQGDEMYIVMTGVLEVFKRDLLGDIRLAELRLGGIAGDMALIEGKPRSANVRAMEDSTVLAIHRAGYERLKQEQPRIATKLQDELLQLISARLRETTANLLGQQG
jgi:CRP/FNR family cyclic AMP-dependent transcriptional regulator